MKLGRLLIGDQIVLAVLLDDGWRDLNAVDASIPNNPVTALATERPAVEAAIAKAESSPIANGKVKTPLDGSSRIFCIGLNYSDHAAETNSPLPSEPIVFSKFSSTFCDPGDPIVLPGISDKVDFEAELVVVIGKSGKHVSAADAMDYVVGYTNGNDVSARDWQKGKPGKQWLLGKTFDTFAPLGPALVTADEVGEAADLNVCCRVSGETMQQGSTSNLIFGVREVVSYISQVVELQPGDAIFTGTPAGVGDARTPPRYLRDGDVVEIEIGPFGVLSNPCVAEAT